MGRRVGRPGLFDEAFQHTDIALFVTGFVYRSFGDEGGVTKAGVVKQAPERLNAHSSLPYVLVPVEL